MVLHTVGAQVSLKLQTLNPKSKNPGTALGILGTYCGLRAVEHAAPVANDVNSMRPLVICAFFQVEGLERGPSNILYGLDSYMLASEKSTISVSNGPCFTKELEQA